MFKLAFSQDGTSQDKLGRNVPLSLCPETKKFSCPGVHFSRDKGRSKSPGRFCKLHFYQKFPNFFWRLGTEEGAAGSKKPNQPTLAQISNSLFCKKQGVHWNLYDLTPLSSLGLSWLLGKKSPPQDFIRMNLGHKRKNSLARIFSRIFSLS
jgi:hypothetical protein